MLGIFMGWRCTTTSILQRGTRLGSSRGREKAVGCLHFTKLDQGRFTSPN